MMHPIRGGFKSMNNLTSSIEFTHLSLEGNAAHKWVAEVIQQMKDCRVSSQTRIAPASFSVPTTKTKKELMNNEQPRIPTLSSS